MQGIWSSSPGSHCSKSKCKTSLVCVSSSRSHGLEVRHLPTRDGLSVYAVPLSAVLGQILLNVSDHSEPLNDPGSSSLASEGMVC